MKAYVKSTVVIEKCTAYIECVKVRNQRRIDKKVKEIREDLLDLTARGYKRRIKKKYGSMTAETESILNWMDTVDHIGDVLHEYFYCTMKEYYNSYSEKWVMHAQKLISLARYSDEVELNEEDSYILNY